MYWLIYIYSTLVCLYDASNILFNIFYVINIELSDWMT